MSSRTGRTKQGRTSSRTGSTKRGRTSSRTDRTMRGEPQTESKVVTTAKRRKLSHQAATADGMYM